MLIYIILTLLVKLLSLKYVFIIYLGSRGLEPLSILCKSTTKPSQLTSLIIKKIKK